MFFAYGPPWFVITCLVIYLIASGVSKQDDNRENRIATAVLLSLFVIPLLAAATYVSAIGDSPVTAILFSVLFVGIGALYAYCVGAYVGSLPSAAWQPHRIIRQVRTTKGNALLIEGRIVCPVCKGDAISDIEMGEQFYECASCRMKLLPPDENAAAPIAPRNEDRQAMKWLDSE